MPIPLRTKLYLSGPMTGIAENNYPAFNRAAKQLRAAGFDVVNPAELGCVGGGEGGGCKSWTDYLKRDIPNLIECNAVATLEKWWASKGARLEVTIATSLDMPVYTVNEILAHVAESATET